ncbi:MAG: S-layer homology domain-containing protein [Clostridiales Family XIII bacterium]|jgi:hypothetical protein|nr:S-layer homology domain-containing protein [Clostridiales Family XIII bacterium]
MKKIRFLRSCALVASVVALLAAPAGAFGASYGDLPAEHWAHAAVEAMREKGIVNGFPDGSFRPADTVTYGAFIKMAYLAQGGEARADAGEGWALPYYEAAAEAGLLARHEMGADLLSAPIPRAHMAAILSKILGAVEIPSYDAVRERLGDIEWDTPHEYDIVKVTAHGLITGYPDKTFRPEATLTRAEAATVIHRLTDADARALPDLRPAGEKTPAERLADAEAVNIDPLLRVAEASVSKRPISEVIDGTTIGADHLDTYVFADGTIVNAIGEPIRHYELFADYPYRMKLVLNLVGDEALAIGPQNANGFLIKDRKVTAYLEHGKTADGTGTVWVRFGEGYDAKTFPDFDYVGISPSGGDVLLLIPNNLR